MTRRDRWWKTSSPASDMSGSPTSLTLTERARKGLQRVIDLIASVLARTPVTPNALTLIGAGLNALVAWIAAAGNLALAGVVLLLSGLFDSLDGALARRTGTTSKF